MDEGICFFEYEPLGRGDRIRLIRLEPDGLTRPAGFEIQTFEISKAPEYYALSYCWGNPDRTDFVTCNGSRLLVTPHLKGGLQELLIVPLLRKWFWIDQICINQEDLGEQSHQVQLMTRIYSEASRTIVWLGPALLPNTAADRENYVRASEFASHIYNIGQNHGTLSFEPILQKSKLRPGGWSGGLPAARALQTPADLDRWGLPPLADCRWGALCAVFAAPWFSRVWVIREVFASRDEPIVVGHGRCHGFLHLLWAGYFMSQNFQLLRQSEHIKTPSAAEASLSHTRLLLQLAISKMEWTLEGILWRTVAYGATKQVDKYFAVVDLTLYSAPGASLLPVAISPDYLKSLADVGRDFTRHVVNNSPSLLIFSLINHDDASIARCPDESSSWAYMPSRDSDSALLRFGHERTILLAHGSAYFPKRRGHDVGTYFSPRVAPKRHTSMLTLQGRKFDSVQAVPLWCTAPKARLWHWIEFAYQVQYADKACEDIDRFLEDFFETITAREDFEGRDVGVVPGDFYAWLQECLDRGGAGFPPTRASLEPYMDQIRQLDKPLTQQGDARQVERWNEKYETGPSRYRQFGILKDGTMVLGPRAMAPEDIVCSLDGGELAYVLRPKGDQYLFLGECFVYALSNGYSHGRRNMRTEWFSLI